MDNDSECFEHGVSAAPATRFGGVRPQPEPAGYRFEDIGYEAADPSLQALLWHEPKQALPAGPDGR
jgi:hypothetical protein